MAEYHYKYTKSPSSGSGNPPKPPRGAGGPPSGEDLVSWIIIVIALGVFWPLGLFLLFRKLMNSSTSSRSSQQVRWTDRSTAQSGQTNQAGQADPAAQTAQTASKSGYTYSYTYNTATAAQRKKRQAQVDPATMSATFAQKPVKASAGRGFIISGSILTGIFGFSFLMELLDALSWGGLLFELTSLAGLACFTGIGLVLLYVGLFRRKKAKMFRKYLALIGRRESVSITTLSKATGRSYKKVCDDLQDMLDQGILPMGYLDLAGDKLVISTQGISDEPQEAPQPQEEKVERDDNTILREIREVNDSIPDPVMSAKIDRIGEITGKILDYQRKNPDKAGQLRSFLNYYLPTTLKILRAYAQLDEQGIEGENISAAKARIEGMMDKVVEGFEKQLDKLFQDDALDITSDVAVLEKMLDKDGLSEGGMTMGGV